MNLRTAIANNSNPPAAPPKDLEVTALIGKTGGSVQTLPDGRRVVFDNKGNPVKMLEAPSAPPTPSQLVPSAPTDNAGFPASQSAPVQLEGSQASLAPTSVGQAVGSAASVGTSPSLAAASTTVTVPVPVALPAAAGKLLIQDVPPTPAEIEAARNKNQGIVPPDAPKNDVNYVPEEKKKRGRPVKAAPFAIYLPISNPAAAATVQVESVQAPEPSVQPAVAVAQAPSSGAQALLSVGDMVHTPPVSGIHLYVNAIPYHVSNYLSLDTYAAALAKAVTNTQQVLDFSLVEYGKGKGYLAAAARAEPPPPGVYVALVADWGSALGIVCTALLPICTTYTRGVS